MKLKTTFFVCMESSLMIFFVKKVQIKNQPYFHLFKVQSRILFILKLVLNMS